MRRDARSRLRSRSRSASSAACEVALAARALLPAGLADLGAQRVELAPVVAQLALGLGPRPLALGLRAGPDGLERVAQLALAPLRVGQRLLRLLARATRAPRSTSAASRSAPAASASSSETCRRSGAIRARARSGTPSPSPSRSAICSACDAPGRPSVMRYVGASVSGSKPTAALMTPSVALAHSFSSG